MISRVKTIVITGGIGSGKSEVCRILSKRGVPVYDSDSRTKSLYERRPSLVDALCKTLGTNQILNDKGGVDRRKLASLIFNNPNALKLLESVVHPAVLEDFCHWKETEADFSGWKLASEHFVVFESAIVLEKPLFKGFADKVVLVDAPLKTRIERACKRDVASMDAILARISKQTLMNDISEGRVTPDVDYIILNDDSTEVLEDRVLALFV